MKTIYFIALLILVPCFLRAQTSDEESKKKEKELEIKKLLEETLKIVKDFAEGKWTVEQKKEYERRNRHQYSYMTSHLELMPDGYIHTMPGPPIFKEDLDENILEKN